MDHGHHHHHEHGEDCHHDHDDMDLFEMFRQSLPPHIRQLPHEKQIEFFQQILAQQRNSNHQHEEQVKMYRQYIKTVKENYKMLHPDLLTLDKSFFVSSFWNALFPPEGNKEEIPQKRKQRLMSILKEESPGIYSFDMLTSTYCNKLLEEIAHFETWCVDHQLQVHRPNSMNNYGAILDDFGFEDILQAWSDEFVMPFVNYLYPHLANYDLEEHHGFVVEYKMGKDEKLDFHVDDSEVTLNVCLGKQFTGGTLFFEGARCVQHQQADTKKGEHFVYTHTPGKAIFHLGKHRHGAYKITSGERYNLYIFMEGAPAIIVYGVWAGVILFALKQIRDRFFTIDVGRVAQVPKRPKRTPPEKRDYTAEELKQYDGNDPSKAILLGVKGKIYNVSDKEEFYGPGGAYSAFAGRDASRALAKGVTDPAEANNPSIDDLKPDEIETLNEWAGHYDMRYEFIGNIIKS